MPHPPHLLRKLAMSRRIKPYNRYLAKRQERTQDRLEAIRQLAAPTDEDDYVDKQNGRPTE
jgi:hypothetical protein